MKKLYIFLLLTIIGINYSCSAQVTTEDYIKQFCDYNNDGICGIYEAITTNRQSGYKLGCIKEDGNYYLIYLGCKTSKPYWEIGDIKAKLHPSATEGFFKADWYMADKSIESDWYIAFNGTTMKTIYEGDEDVYIKMYPTSMSTNPSEASPSTWTGTGFALKDGNIVTNYHVVADAKTMIVKGVNGNFSKEYHVEVVAIDKNNDLALLKISESNFAGFGTIPYKIKTTIADVGEDVFVLGYPLTSTMGDEIKLTTGIISSKTGFQGDVSLYQISAPIQPGNSGGPLFDGNGNIIGVVNAKHTGAENVGYAIKSSYLVNLIESAATTSIIPTNNTISGQPLSGKVKNVKNFIFLVECTNQVNKGNVGSPKQPPTHSFINKPKSNIPCDGLFSVSSTKKVIFSKGNLQYQASTKTWRFAEHQWDIIGYNNKNISNTYSGWIDLFGWGTGDNPTKKTTMKISYSSFHDWGFGNSISNGMSKKWRTLTRAEWVYVLEKRTTLNGARYAKATVCGRNGLIILPDKWSNSYYHLYQTNNAGAHYSSNIISQTDWVNIFEKNGAVFLPAAGYREGTSVDDVENYGEYWTSDYYDSDYAILLVFSNYRIQVPEYLERSDGRSVRLVTESY